MKDDKQKLIDVLDSTFRYVDAKMMVQETALMDDLEIVKMRDKYKHEMNKRRRALQQFCHITETEFTHIENRAYLEN